MGSTKVDKCRTCGASDFVPVFDFGEQVIANHFHRKDDPESPPLPLNLVRCGKCSLVQLADITEPDLMYRNYWYRSGVNQSMRDHLRGLAEQILGFIRIGSDDSIVDIGCNDGTFLGLFPVGQRIGIDPSNIKPTVPCEYVNDYFTYETASRVLRGRKAKLITSIAMFYDLNDPVSFVRDIRRTLEDDGLWVAELSYLPTMMGNTAYDSVCHEHVAYYRMGTFLEAIKE
jgi:NDP-4-keto-2,6-dideoxyhexose 3-C-methyltransferase